MGKLPEGATEIGRLVFRNTMTRGDAVYVVQLLQHCDVDSGDELLTLGCFWGKRETYLKKHIGALHGHTFTTNEWGWSKIYSDIEDIAKTRLKHSYDFVEDESSWPCYISRLHWGPSPTKPAPQAVIYANASVSEMKTPVGGAAARASQHKRPVWANPFTGQPVEDDEIQEAPKPKDPDRDTIAGYLEL